MKEDNDSAPQQGIDNSYSAGCCGPTFYKQQDLNIRGSVRDVGTSRQLRGRYNNVLRYRLPQQELGNSISHNEPNLDHAGLQKTLAYSRWGLH